VHCYDENCKILQDGKKYLTMDMDVEMIRLHDEAYGHIDLHAQEHNIKWDMDYVQS
jgi:hypothetical protein